MSKDATGATPGPWQWDPVDPEDGPPHSLASATEALAVYFEPGRDMTPRDRANLVLIAAAPDMAALLRRIGVAREEGWYEDHGGWSAIDTELRRLLEAIGRSP